ncbi:hypothetical protein [Rubritalea marina]|uniref:hypothetical protein n=1 Tax=Rubritalea marina TaxID=361055 RepID=UPI00036191B9|nr:hypothetical protein [Rubritalea marina]
MTSLRFTALILILSSCFTFAQEFAPPPLARSKVYRSTLRLTNDLQIYEGLPHQLHEKKLLKKELQRDDVVRFAGFPFYIPSVSANNAEALIQVLADKKSITVYGGLKPCGAYHPDYCVSWKKGPKTYYALICYGCGEIVFYDGRKPLMYDLTHEALEKLKDLLVGYEHKRPRKK